MADEGGGLMLNITRGSGEPTQSRPNAKERRSQKKIVRNRRWDRERVSKRAHAKQQGRAKHGETWNKYIRDKEAPSSGPRNPQPGDGYSRPRNTNETPLGQRSTYKKRQEESAMDVDDIVAEALGLAKAKEQTLAQQHQAEGIVHSESGGVKPMLLPEDGGSGAGFADEEYPAPCVAGNGPGNAEGRKKKDSKKRERDDRSTGRKGRDTSNTTTTTTTTTSSTGTVSFDDKDVAREEQVQGPNSRPNHGLEEDPYYIAARALQGFDPSSVKDKSKEEEVVQPKKKHRGAKHEATDAPKARSQSEVSRVPLGKVVRPSALFGEEMYADIGLDDRLVQALDTQGITKVTKIQALTIPPLLGGSDVMIKSLTGSGKTLSFVVPMLQRLVSIRTSRADGTLSLIIGPTRELCQQLASVVQSLSRPFPWLVVGTLIGGDQRKHEKARLRKGVSIVVGSPGRLLDHLQNTKSWVLTNLRWLILDEADRLLDLGFENQLLEILKELSERQSIRIKRQNVLASATLNSKVERLQKFALADGALTLGFDAAKKAKKDRKADKLRAEEEKKKKKKKHRRASNDSSASSGDGDSASSNDGGDGSSGSSSSSRASGDSSDDDDASSEEHFILPSNLTQQFMITDIKEKLLHLCAFLRWKSENHKIIVFFASCDSVDFHAGLLPQATYKSNKGNASQGGGGGNKDTGSDGKKKKKKHKSRAGDNSDALSAAIASVTASGGGGGGGDSGSGQKEGAEADFTGDPALLSVPVFKLHGNIAQVERTKAIAAFRKADRAILMCTDVAARGLDIQDVDWIIQYEVPGDPAEYVHRIGRTARLGKEGHALLFLTASETEYVAQLRARGADIKPLSADVVLKTLAPSLRDPALAAARLQARLEFAVEKDRSLTQTAGLAFQSTIRAYTAQPKLLKSIFSLKNVHLGHLAKAFALKQTPSKIAAQQLKIRRKQEAEQKHKKQQQRIRKQYNNAQPHRHAADEFAA